MERRLSIRKPVDVSVYLSCAGHRLIRCDAVDISNTGIYVKSNPLYLPRNIQLKLIFVLRKGSSNIVRIHQIPAIVTRAETNGVGMAFCNRKSAGQSASRPKP